MAERPLPDSKVAQRLKGQLLEKQNPRETILFGNQNNNGHKLAQRIFDLGCVPFTDYYDISERPELRHREEMYALYKLMLVGVPTTISALRNQRTAEFGAQGFVVDSTDYLVDPEGIVLYEEMQPEFNHVDLRKLPQVLKNHDSVAAFQAISCVLWGTLYSGLDTHLQNFVTQAQSNDVEPWKKAVLDRIGQLTTTNGPYMGFGDPRFLPIFQNGLAAVGELSRTIGLIPEVCESYGVSAREDEEVAPLFSHIAYSTMPYVREISMLQSDITAVLFGAHRDPVISAKKHEAIRQMHQLILAPNGSIRLDMKPAFKAYTRILAEQAGANLRQGCPATQPLRVEGKPDHSLVAATWELSTQLADYAYPLYVEKERQKALAA